MRFYAKYGVRLPSGEYRERRAVVDTLAEGLAWIRRRRDIALADGSRPVYAAVARRVAS